MRKVMKSVWFYVAGFSVACLFCVLGIYCGCLVNESQVSLPVKAECPVCKDLGWTSPKAPLSDVLAHHDGCGTIIGIAGKYECVRGHRFWAATDWTGRGDTEIQVSDYRTSKERRLDRRIDNLRSRIDELRDEITAQNDVYTTRTIDVSGDILAKDNIYRQVPDRVRDYDQDISTTITVVGDARTMGFFYGVKWAQECYKIPPGDR